MKGFITFLGAFIFAVFALQAQVSPTVFAEGFDNGLIGVNIDAEGNVWVGEMGSGNNDGKIYIVSPDGDSDLFMSGLPSAVNPMTGEIAGSYRAYQMAGDRVMILVGEGPHALSEAFITVDKNDYSPGNPLTLDDVLDTMKVGDFVHDQGFQQSNPYNFVRDEDGNMIVVDAGANSVLKLDTASEDLSILTTFPRFPNPGPVGPPMIDPVPTDVLKNDDGYYICQLTGFPFPQGASNLYHLNTNDEVSVVDSGFTCITDMAYDPLDSNLCVLQYGVFGQLDSTMGFKMGTAAVIKLYPDGSRDTIASGINGLAPSMNFDASGDLYVTDQVFGQVLKFELETATQDLPEFVSSVKAYPNPFSDQLKLNYELERSAEVSLEIFDVRGKRKASIREGRMPRGTHTIQWHPDAGDLRNGTYFYRLRIDNALVTGTLQFVK